MMETLRVSCAILRDRMWTPSAITPIAARAGLRVEQIIDSYVQDGAAIGMAPLS